MMTLLIPPGLFYLVRIGFGILGPLAMGPMVWHTARIHATQSATGILYATLFLVLVGEMTSNFLLTRTPFPF
jgi:protein NrfD